MPPSVTRRQYGQLPAHTYTGWNNLGDVHRTLQELEFGRFRMAAIMVDQMFRDDRFSAVMDTRIDALDSIPFIVKPGNESAKAQAIADDLGGTDDLPARWGQQFPPEDLGELVQWGIMLGLGVAEIIWDFAVDASAPIQKADDYIAKRGKRVAPRIKIWHPQWVRWDWGTFCYKIQTVDGEVDLPRLDENPHGDGKWLLYCPRGYHQAWMKGAVRSLSVSVLERGGNRRRWGRFNEKYGLPLDVLKAPASATGEVKDATFAMVANRGGETAIMLESTKDEEGEEGTGEAWEFDIVEVKGGTAWQTFDKRQDALNTDIAIKLLGQNLTTEVGDGGGRGSAEQGHNDIRIEKLKKDASLAPKIRDQVLWWDADFNYGDPEMAPKPYWQVDPPDDLSAKGTTALTVGQSMVAFKTAGAPVDQRAMLEKFEIDALTEEEEAAQKALAAEQAAEAQAKATGTNNPPGKTAPDPVDGDTGDVADDKIQAAAARGAFPGTTKVAKRYAFQGMPIAVENPVGTTRVWKDTAMNQIGAVKMVNDYGFLEGFVGNDGDDVDCYIGPDAEAAMVYNVHQYAKPDYRRYDEDKVMIGFSSADAALAAYAAHRDDGMAAVKGVSAMPVDVFKAKLVRRKGKGRIRAGATAREMNETTLALRDLVVKAHGAAAMAAKTKKPKDLKTADRLIKTATMMATSALAPYLVAVKAEVAMASSPADLEKRLLVAFRNEHPGKLAEVFKRTRMLSHLAGDLSVVRQVQG